MCWNIGDDYVFLLVRSDQSERITRMAITWSFSCSGSVSALLRQICRTNWDICGAYWRHNATQGADIHSSLFVTKSVTFVSHQNVCVTQCVGSTPPPPLFACFRSLKTSGSRDLCKPTVLGVVGREGIPGNKSYRQVTFVNIVLQTWSLVGMPWKGESRRGVARSTQSWKQFFSDWPIFFQLLFYGIFNCKKSCVGTLLCALLFGCNRQTKSFQCGFSQRTTLIQPIQLRLGCFCLEGN